jgi:hypothetical protein
MDVPIEGYPERGFRPEPNLLNEGMFGRPLPRSGQAGTSAQVRALRVFMLPLALYPEDQQEQS